MATNILAIDIGGSKISVGIMDELGKIIENYKSVLPKEYDQNYILDSIYGLIEPLMKHQPKAIGIAVPGLTDAKSGVWKYAPFSGVSEFRICDIISQKTGLPCFAENDVNVCAVGEKFYGCTKDDENFIWVTISNGVGGAIYLNGELFVGNSGNAGEIGHFYVNDKTYVCGCGRRGCLETFASGQAISREYQKRTGRIVTAKEISELARKGEKQALEVFNRAGSALGKAFSYCVNLLNINKIVVGGGVSSSLDLIMPSVEKTLKKHVFEQANDKLIVIQTALGYDAALIGAGALAQKNMKIL